MINALEIYHVLYAAGKGPGPFAPIEGSLSRYIKPAVVKAMVKAKYCTLTIRALISLVWSRWSRWSRQNSTYRTCARAHARVSSTSLILINIFKLIKNALTTLTTPIKTMVYALTTALTIYDHLDHMEGSWI